MQQGEAPLGHIGGALPEVTKDMVLVLLLGALFTMFMLMAS